MSFKRYHESKNLFDCQTVTLGKWTNSSGYISDVAYGAISEVIPANTITITCNAELKPYSYSVVWLQSDNTFISREHKSSASAMAIPQTFTPPVNAEKFYFQVANGSDMSNPITKEQITNYKIMLNTGSTALPYEPYSEVWHDISVYIRSSGNWAELSTHERTNRAWT